MSKKSLTTITRLTAREKQLRKTSFEKMYQSAMKTVTKDLFAEMYDSYEQEEAHQKAKYTHNMLPHADKDAKIEDGESYSEDDMESLGLKDAKSDKEIEAEDQEVEVSSEEQSKFDKMFAVAMNNFEKKDEEEAEDSFEDQMKALEDKALLHKMKEEDAEECSDDEEGEYDNCEHCTSEDAECEHCGEEDHDEEEDHDDEDVVEENAFERLWGQMNEKRLHEEGKRKPMSVGAILGQAEQGEKVGPDGKAIPNEDAEQCDHEDAEECDKHEDKTHTPEDHYGKKDAAYDLKASEVKDEDYEGEEEDHDDEDVVEEGTATYMTQVIKVDEMMAAPEAPVALVAESAVVEVKPSVKETYTEEKVVVESYAGGFHKTLK